MNSEEIVGDLAQSLGDGVSVAGAQSDNLENQHVESAAEQLCFEWVHGIPRKTTYTTGPTECQRFPGYRPLLGGWATLYPFGPLCGIPLRFLFIARVGHSYEFQGASSCRHPFISQFPNHL